MDCQIGLGVSKFLPNPDLSITYTCVSNSHFRCSINWIDWNCYVNVTVFEWCSLSSFRSILINLAVFPYRWHIIRSVNNVDICFIICLTKASHTQMCQYRFPDTSFHPKSSVNLSLLPCHRGHSALEIHDWKWHCHSMQPSRLSSRTC